MKRWGPVAGVVLVLVVVALADKATSHHSWGASLGIGVSAAIGTSIALMLWSAVRRRREGDRSPP